MIIYNTSEKSKMTLMKKTSYILGRATLLSRFPLKADLKYVSVKKFTCLILYKQSVLRLLNRVSS